MVMTYKRFPYYWPFVKGIKRSLLDTLHEWPAMLKFDIVLFDEHTVKQTVGLSVIWDAMSLMYRHCGVSMSPSATITLQVRRTDHIALLTS